MKKGNLDVTVFQDAMVEEARVADTALKAVKGEKGGVIRVGPVQAGNPGTTTKSSSINNAVVELRVRPCFLGRSLRLLEPVQGYYRWFRGRRNQNTLWTAPTPLPIKELIKAEI